MDDLGNPLSKAASITERLPALVRQVLGPPAASGPLPIDARLSDLGLTSVKMVRLILNVEMELDLTIPQSEITPENFFSVASIHALIARLLAAPNA